MLVPPLGSGNNTCFHPGKISFEIFHMLIPRAKYRSGLGRSRSCSTSTLYASLESPKRIVCNQNSSGRTIMSV